MNAEPIRNLKDSTDSIIKDAYHGGLSRGYKLGYMAGQTEKTNRLLIGRKPRPVIEIEDILKQKQEENGGKDTTATA